MTRSQWEGVVIQKVCEAGGFSIFWVTQNKFIANAADRLHRAGRMAVSRDGCRFPWSNAVVIPCRWAGDDGASPPPSSGG